MLRSDRACSANTEHLSVSASVAQTWSSIDAIDRDRQGNCRLSARLSHASFSAIAIAMVHSRTQVNSRKSWNAVAIGAQLCARRIKSSLSFASVSCTLADAFIRPAACGSTTRCALQIADLYIYILITRLPPAVLPACVTCPLRPLRFLAALFRPARSLRPFDGIISISDHIKRIRHKERNKEREREREREREGDAMRSTEFIINTDATALTSFVGACIPLSHNPE